MSFPCFHYAQGIGIGQWRDHLPYDYATTVEEAWDYIFCSTPYSLFYYDRPDNRINRLSKVNGLSDIGVSSVSYNQDQSILVVAYTNTNIDLILKNLVIINIPDIKRKEILGLKTINSVMNYGRYAYLSCGFGIVVLDLQRKEIKDTYYIGPDGGAINVLSMAYNDTAFFAATEKGIYYADKNNPNLAYFGNWTKMEDIPDPEGYYNIVHVYQGKLFINLHTQDNPDDDLMVLDNGQWRDLETESTLATHSLRTCGDKLVVSYSYFVNVYDPDLARVLNIYTYGVGGPAPNDAIIGSDNFYWIADQNVGLAKVWGEGYEREFIKPTGAPTADIFNISAGTGELWLVPGGITATWGNTWKTAQVFSFINETWNTYDPSNTPALDSIRDMVCVAVDPYNNNRVFAGSWSRGLLEFNNNSLTQIYNNLNSSLLPNVIEGLPSIKIGGLAFDKDHNLWMTNSGAEKLVAVRREDGTATGSWQSYSLGGSTIGLDVRKIIVDANGQKWILPRTSQSNPYYIIVFNEMNEPTKQVKGLQSGTGQGGLPGTNVFAIAEDLEGQIWVGTDEGIAVFFSPQNVFSGSDFDAQRILVNFDGYVQYLLETETVKVIAIDGANQKWIGTDRAGVFLLSADGTKQIYHFTEENSPLLSNTITDIAIDDNGEVFIGTAKGLISYRGIATPGPDANTGVYAYPNPVKPGYNGPIAIKGVVKDASVKITDVSGTLIFETKAEGGQAIWDGRNFDGRHASSGIYMVFITNSDGSEKMVTKILFLD
jgi:sugar lactone lactonase YvrE